MISFRVWFYGFYIVGFGSCHAGVINVAAVANGGVCSSTFVTHKSCSILLDGNVGNTNKWIVTGNVTGKAMMFTFDSVVEFRRIEVVHAYDVEERNIKKFMVVIDNSPITEFELANRIDDKLHQRDGLNFSGPLSNALTLIVTDMYNATNTTTSVLIEIEIYGIPTSITTATFEPSLPTATRKETSTNTPDQASTAENTILFSTILSTISATKSFPSPITESTTTQSSSTTQPTKPSTFSSTLNTVTKSVTTSISIITTASTIRAKPSTPSTQSTNGSSSEIGQPKSEDNNLGLIVGLVLAFLVIVVVVLVVVFFIMRRKKRQQFDYQERDQNGYVNYSMDKLERIPEDEQNVKTQLTVVEPLKDDNLSDSSPETSPESSVQDLKLVDGEPEYTNTQPLPVFSNAIKLNDIASTVDDMLQNPEMFQEEFKSIPAGKQHPTTFADRSTLHTKNRFRNIKPYDHSRVSLIQKESDDSMYINANFISAYNQPEYYIAAQGPNKDSVDDFWRMIWEHRVPVIVMVTNCKEAGKDKCTKYWPNKEDSTQTYDDVDVVFDKNIIAADYKILDFKISKCGETRDVRQYHYTSWPDEGVPTSCSALISFVNRIREYTDDKEPPIVVHCSAGVGRTGTFIAVNYSMDMASHENIVDIQKVVHRLREDRINMVQTLSQYKFLYALMLECLYCGEVTIPCQGASEKIQQIFIKTYGQDSPAEQQWKVLEVFKSKNLEEECLAGKHKDNLEKNRTQDIVPHDNNRPYLRRRPDYTSNYINAVFVDGYKTKNKFLLTQHPLENTIVDLWRTISDFNISTIVMLNSCSDDAQTYWPEDEYSEPLKYGDFLEVTFKRVDKQDEFTITELQIFEDKEKANVVTHIQVKTWSEDSKPKLSILPALYNIVTQAQMADEDSRIMIHNLNGDGNTGVYCALHQIFDKIKEEQEIDIFNAVKNTRMSRPDAIPDMDTYRYLHDASVQFIEQFSTYANFQ